MTYVGLKFVIVEINYLVTLIGLDFRVTFIYLISLFKKVIMQIKVFIIDNIHYIDFIMFNISTLFFS